MLVKKSDRAELLEILCKKADRQLVCAAADPENRRTAQRCLFADNPERGRQNARYFMRKTKKHALLLSYKDCSSARFWFLKHTLSGVCSDSIV